jgi:bromodomain-containing factor 1
VLDIDSLDRGTLHALHEFVTGEKLVASNKASPLKRQRTQYNQVDSHRKFHELFIICGGVN